MNINLAACKVEALLQEVDEEIKKRNSPEGSRLWRIRRNLEEAMFGFDAMQKGTPDSTTDCLTATQDREKRTMKPTKLGVV